MGLVKQLVDRGDVVTVLGRSRERIATMFGSAVAAVTMEELTNESVRELDAIVNLAGENVGASLRWSDATLQEIQSSRVNLTSRLAALISSSGGSCRLLNASGIAAYGYEDETMVDIKDEQSATPA